MSLCEVKCTRPLPPATGTGSLESTDHCLHSLIVQVRLSERLLRGIQVLAEGAAGESPQPIAVGLLLDCMHKVLKDVPGSHAPSLAAYWFTAAGRNRRMQKPVPLPLYTGDLAILSTKPEG